MDFHTWVIETVLFAAHMAPFVLKLFHLFHFHTGEPFLITPEGKLSEKGNSPNSRIGWDRWILMSGVFKLDHLQPNQPILFWYFCTFFTFILGSPFLLPQRANYQKREFSQHQNWMRQMVFSAWDIQTGPFAVLSAHFILRLFHVFHFHTGEPFLITPEGQ